MVLPLPRSGSSMVGGILHHLGVDMGPCKEPDPGNPRGYFEDARFVRMHRAWSRRYETDPTRIRLKLPPWNPPLSSFDLSRYSRVIRTCEQQPRWGVKDPEFCYYAGHFAAVLRCPIHVIATTRDPDTTARSLGDVRRWLSPDDCNAVVAEYTQRQTMTIDELTFHGIASVLTVDYDATLNDPEGAVQRIAEHVGLPVTTAATRFISPELRRHRQSPPVNTPRNNDQGLITLTT